VWEKAGSRIDPSLQLAGDFELWARFFRRADLYGVPLPLGGFRLHGEQKTALHMEAYYREAEAVLARHGGGVKPAAKAPNVFRRLRKKSAAAEPYRVCANRGGRWTVSTQW